MSDRERLEADRDREREPVSLPVLLKTLHSVAADAAALPGRKPAELPTLKDLLARAIAAPPLRDRLTDSAAVAVSRPLSPRRATGAPSRP